MLRTLNAVLVDIGRAAIAVSGGIDSLTLATAAHRALQGRVVMHHATSPAVPAEATERTQALARAQGWALDVFDAGEFSNPSYRANPVNRCFFCKTSLYGAVARRTNDTILSGTNTDDLGEYRPGLDAARNYAVRHPFVEAGIGKPAVRTLAAELGLGALAELPAAPCLSSRVETGIRIEAPVLAMIHQAERLVARQLAAATVRCRVRATGIVIELDPATLAALSVPAAAELAKALASLGREAGLDGPVRFAPYKNGSAFLRVPA